MNGYRTDFKLELLEKQRDHLLKTGLWSPGKRSKFLNFYLNIEIFKFTIDVGVNYTRTAAEGEAQIVEKLQNKTLRVTTVTVRKEIVHLYFENVLILMEFYFKNFRIRRLL
jgi:hypothetical protein